MLGSMEWVSTVGNMDSSLGNCGPSRKTPCTHELVRSYHVAATLQVLDSWLWMELRDGSLSSHLRAFALLYKIGHPPACALTFRVTPMSPSQRTHPSERAQDRTSFPTTLMSTFLLRLYPGPPVLWLGDPQTARLWETVHQGTHRPAVYRGETCPGSCAGSTLSRGVDTSSGARFPRQVMVHHRLDWPCQG